MHPHAQLAAEGAEAAAGQGKFWQMHDQLLDHQGALTGKDLIRYAGELGLDTDRFTADLRNHAGQAKIAADVGLRRPERRLRHAHVLRQRQAAPRRLRHQHALGCGADGKDPDPDQLPPAAAARVLIRTARRRRMHRPGEPVP